MAETKPKPYAGGRIDGWLSGIDTLQPDHVLPVGTLRDAVNVDILASGKVRRRKGIVQRLADPNAHSLHSDGEYIYWANATQLRRAKPGFTNPVTLLTNSGLNSPISYVRVNDRTYFTNENLTGIITPLGTYEPWGIAPPVAPPYATAATAPTHVAPPAGFQTELKYQVTCTFVTATGEESGAPGGMTVTVDDTYQTINLSAIPQPTDSRVTHVRIYSTGMYGDTFFRMKEVPVGVTTTTLGSPSTAVGQQLTSQFHAPPLAGQLVEHVQGRLFVAVGDTIWFTEPFAYGLVDMRKNYLQFQDRVTLLIGVPDGLYVSAAGKTWFIQNPGTPEMVQLPLLNYGAVERAAMHVPNSTDVVWLSDRGFVVGSAGGKISAPTETKVAVERYGSGCIGLIERDGDRRFVAVQRDGSDSHLASSDFITARKAQVDEVR